MNDIEKCPDCGGVLAIIGRRHNCRGQSSVPRFKAPTPSGGGDPVVKQDCRGTEANRRGRPLRRDADNTFEYQKPWLKEGMSRATWYRRRKTEERK